ncbi:MAG: HEAT repeat domain-containing protein [bacterium]
MMIKRGASKKRILFCILLGFIVFIAVSFFRLFKEWKDLDFFWRVNLVQKQGKIGEKIAVHSLVNALKDLNEKSSVRRSAASALGRIGDKTAVPALI